MGFWSRDRRVVRTAAKRAATILKTQRVTITSIGPWVIITASTKSPSGQGWGG